MIIVYSMGGVVAHYFKKNTFQPFFVSVHGVVIADHSGSIAHRNSMANIYDLFTITWKNANDICGLPCCRITVSVTRIFLCAICT